LGFGKIKMIKGMENRTKGRSVPSMIFCCWNRLLFWGSSIGKASNNKSLPKTSLFLSETHSILKNDFYVNFVICEMTTRFCLRPE
jgi:hypothetical protein